MIIDDAILHIMIWTSAGAVGSMITLLASFYAKTKIARILWCLLAVIEMFVVSEIVRSIITNICF